MTDKKQTQPPQHQDQRPGSEEEMTPQPVYLADTYRPAGKLQDRVAIITGADSGIGRAVAVHFALEGARIVLLYLNEYQDAEVTKDEIRKMGGEVIDFAGDVAGEDFCRTVVEETLKQWGRIDILVNNAGEQHPQKSLEDISRSNGSAPSAPTSSACTSSPAPCCRT